MVNDLTPLFPPKVIHTNENVRRNEIITKIEPKQNETTRMFNIGGSSFVRLPECAPTDHSCLFSNVRLQALISIKVYKSEFRGVKIIQQAIFKLNSEFLKEVL